MQLWPPTTCAYLNVMWGYIVNVYLLVTPIRNFTVMVIIPCYIDKMLWIPIKLFSHLFWKSTYMYFLVVAYRYWPKCILPIEWLCITSRPIINVVCWLFLHKKVPMLLNLDTRKHISIVMWSSSSVNHAYLQKFWSCRTSNCVDFSDGHMKMV